MKTWEETYQKNAFYGVSSIFPMVFHFFGHIWKNFRFRHARDLSGSSWNKTKSTFLELWWLLNCLYKIPMSTMGMGRPGRGVLGVEGWGGTPQAVRKFIDPMVVFVIPEPPCIKTNGNQCQLWPPHFTSCLSAWFCTCYSVCTNYCIS